MPAPPTPPKVPEIAVLFLFEAVIDIYLSRTMLESVMELEAWEEVMTSVGL